MPRLLVFQHVPHEILGTLDPLFRNSGFRIRYVNFGRDPHARPSLAGYGGLVVLGGPMNCDEVDRYPHLATEVEVIGEAISAGLPVLGICLGGQLIARALGAEVGRSPEKEIGWYDLSPTEEGRTDPLFSHLRETEKIFQWHGDSFAIPEGAVHLASSGGCPNQAFRYGDRIYGLQFHLEVDQPMIERWLRVPENIEEIGRMNGATSADRIRAETALHIDTTVGLAGRVFSNFVRLFGIEGRRPRPLPSR
jgi:GMP synthase (glutamine-hydrolysing)